MKLKKQQLAAKLPSAELRFKQVLLQLPFFCLITTIEKKRKEKTTPFSVNLMRSQVLYWAAQVPYHYLYFVHGSY